MNKTLNIIACCDNKMGIGIDNKLPWNISSEMKFVQKKKRLEMETIVLSWEKIHT